MASVAMSSKDKRIEKKIKEANRQMRNIFAVIVLSLIGLILYLGWCPQCHGPILEGMLDRIAGWFNW